MLVPVTEAEIAGASNLHFFSRFTLLHNVFALVHQVHVDVVFAVHLGHLVAEREDLDGEHGAPDGAGL